MNHYYYYIFLMLIILIIKGLYPYVTKYVMNVLNEIELFIIIEFFIVIIIFVFLSYKLILNKKLIGNMCKKYRQLTYFDYGFIVTLALFTVISSLLMFDLNRNFSTPFLNNFFLRCISIFMLFMTSIFIFNEKYNWKQYLGLFIIMIGFIITSVNTNIHTLTKTKIEIL